MPLQPPARHDVVIQDQTTGQIDFLKFNGAELVGSFLKDYGLTGWKVVANGEFNGDGHPDLVAQNQSTGFLDFLFLDANANLIASALSNVPVPTVHGAGFFGGFFGLVPGQIGPALVSQLSNGQLDFLVFNPSGVLIASDLVQNTVGLPPMVGVASASVFIDFFTAFAGIGAITSPSVVLQLADGSIDVIGFSGGISPAGPLTMSASFLLPGTTGSPALFALDQDFGGISVDANVGAIVNGIILNTVEMVGVTLSGQIDHLFFNSGYNDVAHRCDEFGTLLENFTLSAGWQIVDAGIVAHTDIFPLT